MPAPKVPPATALVPAFQGPRVPEGTYTVRLVKGTDVLEGVVTLVPDPRNPHPAEDRLLQQRTALDIYDSLGDLTFLADSVTNLRDQANERLADLGEKGLRLVQSYASSLDELHGTLVVADEGGWISGKEQLRERLGNLYGAVTSYEGRPSASQLQRKEQLQAELAAARATGEPHPDPWGLAELGDDSEALHRRLGEQVVATGQDHLVCVGDDAAAGLRTWTRWEEVVERSQLVVVDRPGEAVALADDIDWIRVEPAEQ